MTPREYWRTRTIKMMHANELAEIAEIQEVARRTLGEAAMVPEAEEPEQTPLKGEATEEPRAADLGVEASDAGETEVGEMQGGTFESPGEVQEVTVVEGVLEVGGAGESVVESALEESGLQLESGEVFRSEAESELEPKPEAPESEAGEPSASEEVESRRQIEEAAALEGSSGVGADVEEVGSELGQPESDKLSAGPEEAAKLDGVEEIVEVKEDVESASEVGGPESPVPREGEPFVEQPPEETSVPEVMPADGGVERPASAVRIITFRESGSEIGICPYCGLFVKGSDLRRHKLKHRVRNVFGLQGAE